jgi:long-chain fatty acid transport protein
MNKFKLSNLSISLAIAGLSGNVFAGGFALLEQNASGAGTAYAGKAAIGEDASAAWFNPASVTRLKKRELVLGLHAIKVNAEFINNGSEPAAGRSLGNDGGNPGDLAFVPNFHYSTPLNDKWHASFSVATPFGLATDYDPAWVGRYQGINSQIKTIDLNPSFAYKVDENLSVGAGLSLQYLDAKLTQDVAYPISSGTDGRGTIKGDSLDYGFNLGALLQAGPSTRIGLAYRSNIKHKLKGDVTFDNKTAAVPGAVQAAFADGNLTSTVELPESLALSSVSNLTDRWDLLTDITYTGWSSIQQLKFDRVQPSTGLPIPVQNYNWRNTMRYAVGASYQYTPKTKIKFGVAYDESPVADSNRKVRLPDTNRIVLALGSQYQVSDSCRVDIGFQYIKARDALINDDQEGQGNQYGRVKGSFKGDAQILSTQFSYRF